MSDLTIANTAIRKDAEGRYCLNDLHRASGWEKRHGPSYWLSNAQTKELIAELGGADNPVGPVATVNDGQNNGTYVSKELVYAYAMWISATFHLKVIRAYDASTRGPMNLVIPQTLPEALRLAADLAEQKAHAEARLAIAAPKADALDRIASADGSTCITDAAKVLQVRPKDLFSWLQAHQWIYRRQGGAGWLAYQQRIQLGYLEHKVTTVERSDGTEKVIEAVRVTHKGLARLAEAFSAQLDAA